MNNDNEDADAIEKEDETTNVAALKTVKAKPRYVPNLTVNTTYDPPQLSTPKSSSKSKINSPSRTTPLNPSPSKKQTPSPSPSKTQTTPRSPRSPSPHSPKAYSSPPRSPTTPRSKSPKSKSANIDTGSYKNRSQIRAVKLTPRAQKIKDRKDAASKLESDRNDAIMHRVNSVIRIQSYMRGCSARKVLRVHLEISCAVFIQCFMRKYYRRFPLSLSRAVIPLGIADICNMMFDFLNELNDDTSRDEMLKLEDRITVVIESKKNKPKTFSYSYTNITNNRTSEADRIANLQFTPAYEVTPDEMSMWLDGNKRNLQKNQLPLNVNDRNTARVKESNMFNDFVDQTLTLLDDYSVKAELLASVTVAKVETDTTVYTSSKPFAQSKFEDQLKHEVLLTLPLVSQRKFEHSFNSFKREPKSLKLLNSAIKRIGLSDNTLLSCTLKNLHVTDDTCVLLAKALERNGKMQHLYLNNNVITDVGCAALCEALMVNVTLKVLNISGNFVTDVGALEISSMLTSNKTLLDLNLSSLPKRRPHLTNSLPFPRITSVGGSTIGFSLENNFSLTSLNLTKQRVWDVGASAIGVSISRNRTLKYLNLSCNDIMDTGGCSLAEGLRVNTGVEHLNVSGNGFTDVSGEVFASVLAVNGSIETLDLYDNQLTIKSISMIKESIKVNDRIRVVSVYGNNCKSEVGHDDGDDSLDNLVVANVRRFKEDRHIKNMIIWSKRLYKLTASIADYECFLLLQFNVIKRGPLMTKKTDVISQLQPPNSSLILSTAKRILPDIFINVFGVDFEGVAMESRLWTAWQIYTAVDEAESVIGDVPVKAYNDDSNAYYEGLTRLMTLRVPVPGESFEAGTISIVKLKYYNDELMIERKAKTREAWYKTQKSAMINYKNHVHAKTDLPPDKYVDNEIRIGYVSKYPNGIDFESRKREKKSDFLIRALGNTTITYSGMTEADRRIEMNNTAVQQLNIDGVGAREISLLATRFGTKTKKNQVNIVGGLIVKDGKRLNTADRMRNNSRAHVGTPFRRTQTRTEDGLPSIL